LAGVFFFNSVGKSSENHKQECKSAGHAREKPHLPIRTCVVGDNELIKKMIGWSVKQWIYLPRPYC